MIKNIWILNHYAGNMFFDRGGRHYNFAKYLKRSQYEPVVFCANSNHRTGKVMFETDALWQEQMAEEISVPFVFVKARAYTGNGKQRVFNMLDFYMNVKKAAKEYAAKNGKPDVIYASSVHPLTLVAGIQLAKKFGVKCICEVRDLWPESIVEYSKRLTKKNPIIKLLYLGEKWIYKKADKLIFTMERGYDYIVEQGWEKAIPREKVFYLNNGVDLEVFRENREQYQIQDSQLQDKDFFNVVYTGSIRTVNNLGLLLDAAKQVENPRVRFLIWGAGDELEMLQQRVKDENIQNVFFKGRVEKKYIPYIVSCADLNIAHNSPAPLFRFGISFNKLHDYLAAQKPILSDFPSGHNPAVAYGASMEVEDPTAKSIAQAIEKFAVMDAQEYQHYSDCAKLALQEYSFEALTEKFAKIIGD